MNPVPQGFHVGHEGKTFGILVASTTLPAPIKVFARSSASRVPPGGPAFFDVRFAISAGYGSSTKPNSASCDQPCGFEGDNMTAVAASVTYVRCATSLSGKRVAMAVRSWSTLFCCLSVRSSLVRRLFKSAVTASRVSWSSSKMVTCRSHSGGTWT